MSSESSDMSARWIERYPFQDDRMYIKDNGQMSFEGVNELD